MTGDAPLPSVRRAAVDDLALLVGLHRQFCDIDDHPFDERRAVGAFGPLLADDTHGIVWIVDQGAGYAVLTWGWSIEAGGREAVLDEFFVVERGRGRGTRLLEHVIEWGRSNGLARIFLETESANARVRSMYVRHGFVVDDSIWMSHDLTESTRPDPTR